MNGYPPQFVAVTKLVLKRLTTEQLAQLALYASWRDSWETRDPTKEMFWDGCLENLFDHKTSSGYVRMKSDVAELVCEIANDLVGERMDAEKGETVG